MGAEEQVVRGVENCLNIVIDNVENDASTAADNDVQLEIRPVEVGLLTKPKYKSESESALQGSTASDNVSDRP